MNEDYKKFNTLINRIEFHEFKSSGYVITGIETQVYLIKDKLIEFCEWIAGEEWVRDKYEKQFFESNLAQKMKSKAKDPNFVLRISDTSIVVHPKQNMVSCAIVGIHYICQHSFDMFPHDVKESFRSYIPRVDMQIGIGLLYPRPVKGVAQDPILVYNKDIDRGFMQSRETNLTYKDNFVTFIKAQRANEATK